MSDDERFAVAAESPAELVELNLDLERGPMIVDDLTRLPTAPLVLADGSTVLPELVAQGHAARDRAAWLLPTLEVHRAFHESHGMAHLVEYRWLVIQEVERQAVACDVQVVRVDGSLGPDDVLADVEGRFADALAEGPVAESPDERRALLVYANEATVQQAGGFLARRRDAGDETTFVREFRCECDDPECDAVVPIPVAEYVAGISAHG
jgi:hypothetical protein